MRVSHRAAGEKRVGRDPAEYGRQRRVELVGVNPPRHAEHVRDVLMCSARVPVRAWSCESGVVQIQRRADPTPHPGERRRFQRQVAVSLSFQSGGGEKLCSWVLLGVVRCGWVVVCLLFVCLFVCVWLFGCLAGCWVVWLSVGCLCVFGCLLCVACCVLFVVCCVLLVVGCCCVVVVSVFDFSRVLVDTACSSHCSAVIQSQVHSRSVWRARELVIMKMRW